MLEKQELCWHAREAYQAIHQAHALDANPEYEYFNIAKVMSTTRMALAGNARSGRL